MSEENKVTTNEELFLTSSVKNLIDSHISKRIFGALTVFTLIGSLGIYSFLSNIEKRVSDDVKANLKDDTEILRDTLYKQSVNASQKIVDAERESNKALNIVKKLLLKADEAEKDLQQAQEFAKSAAKSAEEIASFLLKDPTFNSKVISEIRAAKAASFDSGWVKLKQNCETIQKAIGFKGLPTRITGYYKLSNGSIFPWGMNQYGDANQSNGVLLDFDEQGNIFIRLPCGTKSGNNVVHLGWYQNRENSAYEVLINRTDVHFRVILWK